MSTFRHIARSLPLMTMIAFVLIISACSDDDPAPVAPDNGPGPTVPTSWEGTWQFTLGFPPGRPAAFPRAAITAGLRVGDEQSFLTTLCTDTPASGIWIISSENGPIPLTCTGTWTDTGADFRCNGAGFSNDCFFTATLNIDLTRDGESFTGTQTLHTNFEPTCGLQDATNTFDVTAERFDLPSIGCGDFDFEAPQSWTGTWDITEGRLRREEQLICPGDDAHEIFVGSPFFTILAGGFTEEAMELLVYRPRSEGGCQVYDVNAIVLARDGESLAGTETLRVFTVPGDGGGEECTGVATTTTPMLGDRTSTDLSGCSSPR